MNKKDIYKRALKAWGKQSQIIILFEEVAELQKELSKHLRGEDNKDHIAEEIADVEIMLEQMKLLFDIEDRVGQHKSEKINRLNDRVNEHMFRRKTIRQEPIVRRPVAYITAPIEHKPKKNSISGIEISIENKPEMNERLLKEVNKNLSKLGAMSARDLRR